MPEIGRSCQNCTARSHVSAAFCSQCGAPFPGVDLDNFQQVLSFTENRRIGTSSWMDLKRTLIFYVTILGICAFSGIGHHFIKSPFITVFFWLVWAVITVGFAIREWSSVSRAFRVRAPKLKTLLELFGITALVVVFLLAYFASFKFLDWPTERFTEPFTKSHWPIWSIYLLVSIAPGIFEECTYRGVIQTKLTEILSVKEALIIQAALFSIMHFSPLIFISHFVMGLLLGWVRLRVGHIYFGMILHAAWNAACVFFEMNIS